MFIRNPSWHAKTHKIRMHACRYVCIDLNVFLAGGKLCIHTHIKVTLRKLQKYTQEIYILIFLVCVCLPCMCEYRHELVLSIYRSRRSNIDPRFGGKYSCLLSHLSNPCYTFCLFILLFEVVESGFQVSQADFKFIAQQRISLNI